jgi:hypothetical protein
MKYYTQNGARLSNIYEPAKKTYKGLARGYSLA